MVSGRSCAVFWRVSVFLVKSGFQHCDDGFLHQVLEIRRLDSLRRIVTSDFHSRDLTLVFPDEQEEIVVGAFSSELRFRWGNGGIGISIFHVAVHPQRPIHTGHELAFVSNLDNELPLKCVPFVLN